MKKLNIESSEVINKYYELRSCYKVALYFGCSPETIRRILKANNKNLTGWKKRPKNKRKIIELTESEFIQAYEESGYDQKATAEKLNISASSVHNRVIKYGLPRKKGGSPEKITEEQLRKESKTLTQEEIAVKYNLDLCNVQRRLTRMNVEAVKSPKRQTFYIKGGHYKERCIRYGRIYDKNVTLDKVIEKDNGICQICGISVDKNDVSGKGIGRLYPTVDHIKPLSKGGNHIWDNVRLAHNCCNASKCDRTTR